MTIQDQGELKGLDAPGFGERSAEDIRDATREDAALPDVPSASDRREQKTVEAEFDGLENDLIDMGSFGRNGTGTGTQSGGANERFRPTAPRDGEDEPDASAPLGD